LGIRCDEPIPIYRIAPWSFCEIVSSVEGYTIYVATIAFDGITDAFICAALKTITIG